GDRFIAAALARADVPVVIAVNKVDRIDNPHTLAMLRAAGELELCDEIFPISARKGTGVQALVDHLVTLLPEGEFMFDADDASDQSETVMIAELIREQVLRRTFQEVPHSVEVVIDDIDVSRDDLIRVTAFAWVEAESQQGILIG